MHFYEFCSLSNAVSDKGLRLIKNKDILQLLNDKENVVFENDDWVKVAEFLEIKNIYYTEENINSIAPETSMNEIIASLANAISGITDFNDSRKDDIDLSKFGGIIADAKIAIDIACEMYANYAEGVDKQPKIDDYLELNMHQKLRKLDYIDEY